LLFHSLINGQRDFTDKQLVREYQTSDIAYTCVERNANAIAQAPWGVYRIVKKADVRKGLKGVKSFTTVQQKQARKMLIRKGITLAEDSELVQVTDHPLIDRLTSVNEDLNGSQLFKLTDINLEVVGRSYWLCRDETITPLKPWRIEVVRDSNGVVTGYKHRNTDTNSEPLSKDEVIDFRFIDPLDPYAGGHSPLKAALKSLRMSSKYMEWMYAIIANRKRPDWLLIPEDDIGPEEATRTEAKIDQKFGGNNNGLPGVLDKKLKPVNLSYSPTDLAPLEIRKEVVTRMAGAFGIPIPFVNPDASTYSNYETAMEDWARTAIAPRLSLFEQVINENLFKLGIEDDVFVLFDSPVPEDKELELQQETANAAKLTAATTAGVKLTENEKRSLLGFEPIPGGDDLPEDEPTPEPPAPAEQPPAPEPADDESDDGEAAKSFDRLLQLNRDVAAGDMPRSVAINIAEAMGFTNAKQLIGFVKAKHSECDCETAPATKAKKPSIEEQLQQKVAAFFRRIRSEAVEQVKAVSGLTLKDSLRSLLTKADDEDLPDEFVPLDEWTDELADDVQPIIELGTRQSADGKARDYVRAGADPSFPSVIPAKVKEATEKRAYAFAESTMATTAKSVNAAIEQVRNEIREGVLTGDPIRELTKRVEGVFEDAEKYQAERIARTEASAAVHNGQLIAAKESGIVKAMKPLISSDACPLCMEYEGKEYGLDELDDSGAIDAEQPPYHPNCTCSWTEVLDI
jgi:HK97 family phage portal protein